MSPIHIAQVSDLHLLADSQKRLRGCNPYRSLAKVLDQVQNTAVDLLLLTGDLAEAGEPSAYEHLKDLLRPLGIPVCWLGGNHDDLAIANQVLSPHYPGAGSTLQTLDFGPWQLILLNSVLPDAQFGEGHLRADTLTELEALLVALSAGEHSTHPDSRPETPSILIALHHHPVPVGIDWLDQISVRNGDQLLRLCHRFRAVKVITFGHIHWAFEHWQPHPSGTAPPLAIYGCPSSGLQVIPPQRSPQDDLPGFRRITLYDNGSHETQIQRVV